MLETGTKIYRVPHVQLLDWFKCLPGLRQRNRWYVKLDLSLLIKHWMIPSRGPGWKAKQTKSQLSLLSHHKCKVLFIKKREIIGNKKVVICLTCFRDTGNVSLPQNSGLLTMSLHIFLQDWQTEAQATTCLREGHVFSLSSSRRMTSKSNSGGKLAQQLFWITRGWSCKSWTEPWDFPLWWWPVSLTSKLRLDKLPKLSRTSRTMLRNDILQDYLKYLFRKLLMDYIQPL